MSRNNRNNHNNNIYVYKWVKVVSYYIKHVEKGLFTQFIR